MVNVQFPLTNIVDIKLAHRAIMKEIQAHESQLAILRTMLKQVREYCKHEDQKIGYNERDGHWGNPCPTCGYSY